MPKKRIYKVVFLNDGKVYEIYAREVSQGGLFGFIEVEGFLFGEKTSVVVDPSEETLKSEFAGVERTYLPLQSIVRIDEVEKRGPARIHKLSDSEKVKALPTPLFPPGGPKPS